MDTVFLEQFYEHVILSRYSEVIAFSNITWLDHGKVDLDAWAHYFIANDEHYILLYEDFPGGIFSGDDNSHEIIKLGDKTSIELKFSDSKQIDNIAGWFTLYKEK